MFGYFGIGVNVVFRFLLLGLCVLILFKTDVFAEIQDGKDKEIFLFIDPQCPSCQKAIMNIRSFKNRNPSWSVQIYVTGSVREFVNFIHTQLKALPTNLDYSLDLKNILADRYDVHLFPSYIIFHRGKIKKVDGYVDLNRYPLSNSI